MSGPSKAKFWELLDGTLLRAGCPLCYSIYSVKAEGYLDIVLHIKMGEMRYLLKYNQQWLK